MDLAASNHRNRSIGCATTCKELFELEGELFSNALVLKQNLVMIFVFAGFGLLGSMPSWFVIPAKLPATLKLNGRAWNVRRRYTWDLWRTHELIKMLLHSPDVEHLSIMNLVAPFCQIPLTCGSDQNYFLASLAVVLCQRVYNEIINLWQLNKTILVRISKYDCWKWEKRTHYKKNSVKWHIFLPLNSFIEGLKREGSLFNLPTC